MNISAPFIRRPVATTLLTAGVALAGLAAFAVLPVAPLPNVDAPAISVSASMPGASPEIMASSVATPLERHLGAIADVDDMTSSSGAGSTNIQLTFALSRNIDGAARDVQAAIVAARADLPSAMTRNPTYRQRNTSGASILSLALTSAVLTQGQIYDAADAIVSQRLAQLPGVGAVDVNGSALPAVRVELNPRALFKYGIGLQDIRAAISNANANAPKGALENGGLHYQIYTNDNARTAEQFRQLVIANRNGDTLRLAEVATVTDVSDGATENLRTFGLYNGQPAVAVQIFQQPGANIIDVVDQIKALLPALRHEIDPRIDLVITNDRSVTIRGSLTQVERTLLVAVALVILIVYLFLRTPRAVLIPAVAVPVSLIGTFGAMYLLDYSLDNLSLMALTIATGFVVDDAIVVMENTMRHIESGMDRMQAALLGAREVGLTVLSMSLSLVAVFLPLQLLGGIVGRLFREVTITLSVAILISLLISLTATPMMCARLLGRDGGKPGRFRVWFDRAFNALKQLYASSLHWSLRHRRVVILSLAVAVALNVYLYVVIPKGFFPQQDTGQLVGGMRGDASASFQVLKSRLTDVVHIIQGDPAVATVVGFISGGGGGGGGGLGGGGGGGGANASLTIALKPLAQRRLSADQVIARLRRQLGQVKGVNTFMQSQQDIRTGGRAANSQYQYTLLGADLHELRTWTDKLRTALQDVPEVADVDSDLQPGGLETDLAIDRDAAARFGLTASQIDNTLGDAFTQAQVSTIYNPYSPQQYHVVLEVAPEYRQDPSMLDEVYVSTSGGAVSGAQATQAVAGTAHVGKSAGASAASVASDAVRNLANNALATGGRGNTSTGSAVSTSRENMVPLSAFARITTGTTPVSVNHTGTSVSSSIAFNLPDGVSLGTALAAIDRATNRIGMPSDVHGAYYGTARTFQQSLGNEPWLILAALVAVYIVLGVLYESYYHPLTIISTLPSAGVGALLALLATGMEFSLIAFIGILLLIGIVKKNAIMMIDFAISAQRERGMDPLAAITDACQLRFRPIMMTTLAAIAGALPLALVAGDGNEMRRPLGVAIVGGLVVSQLLTLYTTPVVYLYIEQFRHWWQARSHRAGGEVACETA